MLLTRAVVADEPPCSKAIASAMKRLSADKEVAGAVTLVANRDEVLHLSADGFADVGSKLPMQSDTICWIASMTKPITGTAVMMLAEEGKLDLDDPVTKYLPELADLKDEGGRKVQVTIRQLLTHTSGMAEAPPEELRAARTLAEIVPSYVKRPVFFRPGARWQYCQSSINSAARVVEVVSGEAFNDFLDKRLFQPLGMKDTTFYLSEEQLPRLAKSYRRSFDGTLDETDNLILLGKAPTNRDRFPAANGGLFSTAPDYLKFCQMILRGGEFNGKRFLKPESVKTMTSVMTGELKTGFTPGNGWGLAWCVVKNPQGVTEPLSAGTCGHGGAYGTQAWIDREQGLIYLLMVQRSNFENADASSVRDTFQKLARSEFGKK
jgi:CubicO group peptidase (beta-lactamase class C family)